MIRSTIEDGIAVWTIDNPEKRNALTIPLRRDMLALIEAAETDPAIRAIVITGAGANFSAGADLTDMNVPDIANGRERLRMSHQLVRALIRSSKPILAAVEGWCVGAGLSLAACCDTIVASRDARFMASFGKVGLIPDLGLLHTLPKRIGEGRARQMFLYGEPMDAARAETIGLVDHLAGPGKAVAEALLWAGKLRDSAPLPIAYTKSLLATGLGTLLDAERDVQSTLYHSADHAEGKTAFLEKRKPSFTGK